MYKRNKTEREGTLTKVQTKHMEGMTTQQNYSVHREGKTHEGTYS